MSNITVTPKQAVENIKIVLKAGLVPNLIGQPGASKSAIIKQIADELGYFVMDIRLSQLEALDLGGLPVPNKKKGTFSHLPLNVFPLEDAEIGAKYKGVLLFFDEMNAASRSTQAAAYQIILDRTVGIHKLHPSTLIVCAGNREKDKAIVNPTSTAMQSRLVHIELEPTADDWLAWASKEGIDYRIIAFISQHPRHVRDFNPDETTNDHTFCCPRTLHFASDLCKAIEGDITSQHVPLFTGCIGHGVGMEFVNYSKVFDLIPTRREILDTPLSAKVPSEPSAVYASIALTSDITTVDTIAGTLTYIERFPREFQTVFLKQVGAKLGNLRSIPCVSTWVMNNIDLIT